MSGLPQPQFKTFFSVASPLLKIVMFLCLFVQMTVPVLAQSEHRILVIGTLAEHPENPTATLQPMADYIRNGLADLGVEQVLFVSASDREQLLQLIKHGRVDWVSHTAYNASYFIQHAGMEVMARSWRDGSPTYKSVFFARKDSNVKTLEDLDNRTIAFEHPFSASAFFVPKAILEARGSQTHLQTTPSDEIPSNHIGYSFSRSEYNTAMWVHKGITDAGVFSNMHWSDEKIVPEHFREDFSVLHVTDEIMRAVELVRSDLDSDIKKRLSTLLTEMHKSSNAKPVLSAYFNTAKFDLPSDQELESIGAFALVANGGAELTEGED